MKRYDFAGIEKKWQGEWAKRKLYSPDLDTAKRPFYNLMMFPYPSAAGLHVGHVYTFSGADTYGRFMRRQGYDVFEPMGFDAFGIHAENYALKAGRHPRELIAQTTTYFREQQLKRLGAMFDWSREVNTSEPAYYHWDQWLFLELLKVGLAERKKAPVNWCPSCATVLSDEQAAGGVCERCASAVEQRELAQWFFKITAYAEKLHQNLETIDWSRNVKRLQRNWIGRSEGAEVNFWLPGIKQSLIVFTTRPDTIFGVTYIALAPEHPLRDKLVAPSERAEVDAFYKNLEKRRLAGESGEEKFGVFTGAYAIHPLSGAKVPVWITDYVLVHYGGGAVMGVPAHDRRDFDFAAKYGLEVRCVITPWDRETRQLPRLGADAAAKDPRQILKAIHEGARCYEGAGKLINSSRFSDLWYTDAARKIIATLQAKKLGRPKVTYRLRDWLISRQRYWGTPIPIVYCRECWKARSAKHETKTLREGIDYTVIDGHKQAIVPVPAADLPVLLPNVENFRPTGTGKSPLASVASFVKGACPRCGADARRETDVMDNFVDSSWYFLRYPSVEFHDRPFDQKRTRKWLPVDMYIGGAEHSVLHLMYTRFITMALHDLKHLPFSEPFKKFRSHGMITKDGAKMSKSKGNVVNPNDYFKEYGTDAMRLYLLFIGPYGQGGDFSAAGVRGATRFLQRVWRIGNAKTKGKNAKLGPAAGQMLHKTIAVVTEDIANLKFNTAIARLMEYVNFLEQQPAVTAKERDTLVSLVAPFAPHITEELYHITHKGATSIHTTPWPAYEANYLRAATLNMAVQVNGKTRDIVQVEPGLTKAKAEAAARASAKVAKWLKGKEVVKVIHVPDKMVSFVAR